MIKINLKKNDDVVDYIKISGHAGYAEKGYDIVCASVSCIAITTVNALISINEDCLVYSESDGLLEIKMEKLLVIMAVIHIAEKFYMLMVV